MDGIKLRFRQIHLDFHTSPDITDVGAEFDAEEFASTLMEARVDSITCFARCHHGMMYYDSKLFPERVHPNLKNKNLLMQQIEVCHKYGIRVPIYTTVQWDYYTAENHPEWHVVSAECNTVDQKIYEPGFYKFLCVNTPYRDFLKAHVKEIMEMLPTDGIFFDIVQPRDCSCLYCKKDMIARGLDPSDVNVRMQYSQQMINEFMLDMTNFVRQYNKECSIFYNRGHIGTPHRPVVDAFSHFELESLPSGHWGYMHFPITVRYARNLGIDYLAQTGKFHTMWGDFHSFKNKAALQFECFNMLAMGAKCMIGDQLEPSGKISKPVYELIGSVYREVEKKEEWCRDVHAVTDIGVFTPEEFFGAQAGDLPDALVGVTRMLQESARQFDIIDSKSDFLAYKVLILPDNIPVDEEFAQKLEKYVSNGGALIASFESGMNKEKTKFNLNALGVKLKGVAEYSPDFIIPQGEIGKGLPETEHVMYLKGTEVEPGDGTEILANVAVPYFNRTWKHFCSHLHTPSSGRIGYPGILKKNSCIYFIHPIFTQYNKNAPRWCKQLFINALNMLLPQPLMVHDGPSTVLTAINEQTNKNRWVVHMLHYIPERRCKEIDIIEDVIPLYNLKVSIKVTKEVREVECVPEHKPLEFKVKDGRVEFILPELNGHQMISLNFK